MKFPFFTKRQEKQPKPREVVKALCDGVEKTRQEMTARVDRLIARASEQKRRSA